ncbi:unnamed protein product [Paramecium octaurelia]|uniref:Uncharacterized protein n=1 Tax=Paramecium octaurelia TaxID=43137 RepID=A0A8S1VKS9_PAROT|nr:unnamed protein product [Paramecium octaurelia]
MTQQMLQFPSKNALKRMNAIGYVVLLQLIDINFNFLKSLNQFSCRKSQFHYNFTSSTIYQSYLIFQRHSMSTSIDFHFYFTVIIYCELIQLLFS